MSHEKCYVFASQRPAKRRRVDEDENEGGGLDASRPLREQLYHELWFEQQGRIERVVKSANETTLNEISTFLHNGENDRTDYGSLPAGLILAGPSIAAHSLIFDQIQERALDPDSSTIFIPVASSDSANLRTMLKTIIKVGTAQTTTDQDELELLPARGKKRKLLDYDLQLLHDWLLDTHARQVVVAFRDCEAFDSVVLSETIELLAIWANRIPFTLLLGIATSIETLQDRLSDEAVRSLAGRQFDVVQSEEILETVFTTATVTPSPKLWLGAQLASMLLQRHHENLLSTQDFVDSIQYAYMSHFHANPLSALLSNDARLDGLSEEHIQAVRNTPSFRRFAEQSLKDIDAARKLKTMLESDDAMLQYIKGAVDELQETLTYMSHAIQVACAVNSELSKTKMTLSGLYMKAVSGTLSDTPAVRELLMAVKKAPSDTLSKALNKMQAVVPITHVSVVEELVNQLSDLTSGDVSGQPMRSEHDIRNDTLRTTVVAQKVQLSRHKAKLSEKDEAYSKIVARFHDILVRIFEDVRNPLDMLGHEIVMYDLRMPHRAAFTPKPRFAVERALSSPHDYLNCQCCTPAPNAGKHGDEATLSATLPPTAILYRLYLESGPLINASDLWSAFAAILERDNEDDTSKFMPLFQRALSELKYLGLVKPTRKKTDHITKVAWKGL